MQIQRSPDGDTVTFLPKVVDAGHHQRQLLRVTGMDAEENQARSLLNDLETWMVSQDDHAPDDPAGARPEVPPTAGSGRCSGRRPSRRNCAAPRTPLSSTTTWSNTASCSPSEPGAT